MNSKTIESRLDKIVKIKDFAPTKLKNIIIDFCHAQSTIAKIASCQICSKGVSPKELKKMNGYSYGFTFGQFRNKRHATHPKHNLGWTDHNYFTGNICRECCDKIQIKLDYKFISSYAP